jgi:predicted AlkP superfamily phosphohydrolase/phosphomutase
VVAERLVVPMRTLTLGLQGCSWNVLERLIEAGETPNLAELRKDGATGTLESVLPFSPASAWASFTTGTAPAAHRIFGSVVRTDDGRLHVATQADLAQRPYYEQLGREGKRSIVVNLPLDHTGCDGTVIVNGPLTFDESRRILPIGRRERYRRLLGAYASALSTSQSVEQLRELEQARFDLAREIFLFESWDHFLVVFTATDALGAQATGAYLDGDADACASFARVYRDLDRFVGWFRQRADDALVLVASDHGKEQERAALHLNTLLCELGFAVPHPANESNGASRSRGARGLLRRRPDERTVRPRRASFVESRAFSPTDDSYAIYAPSCSDVEVAEIRTALEHLRLADGTRVVDAVCTPEELYGVAVPSAPALLVLPACGVRLVAELGEEVLVAASGGRGCPARDGVFILAGSGIVPGDLGRRSICDLAPTLLWTSGTGIPLRRDGRILFEAFSDEFASGRPVVEVNGDVREPSEILDEHGGLVADRLRELGYLQP